MRLFPLQEVYCERRKYMWVYSAYITLKDGTRVYAKEHGKKCFCFWVDSNKKKTDKKKK